MDKTQVSMINERRSMNGSPKKLKILHLHLRLDRPIEETATQLRGFMGNEFQKHAYLHHHLETIENKKKLLYRYPTIQYKIYGSKAIILGIGDIALSTLKQVVLGLEELKLGCNVYRLQEIRARYAEPLFGLDPERKMHLYRFLTPWLALNEENYKKFTPSLIAERRTLLEKVLIGNLLSMSKYLEYEVPDRIHVETEVYPLKVIYKNVSLIGFKGLFECNFLIPDFMGVGKAASHGFGTIKKIEDNSRTLK